jgi:hypothetical protein
LFPSVPPRERPLVFTPNALTLCWLFPVVFVAGALVGKWGTVLAVVVGVVAPRTVAM